MYHTDNLDRFTLDDYLKGYDEESYLFINLILGELASKSEFTESERKFLKLFENLCLIYIDFDEKEKYSLKPLWERGMEGSFVPSKLSIENARDLFKYLPSIGNLFVKAMVADILWCTKFENKYESAIIAIDYYNRAAHLLTSKPELSSLECSDLYSFWGRLLTISRQIGKCDREKLEQTSTSIFTYFLGCSASNVNVNIVTLLKYLAQLAQLAQLEFANRLEVANKCESIAFMFENRKDYFTAKDFQECRKAFSENNHKLIKEIQTKIANLLVSQASICKDIPSKISILRDAIDCHRKAGNKDKANELHRDLCLLQNDFSNPFTTLSTEPIDISENVAKAIKHVTRNNLKDSFIALIDVEKTINIFELKDSAKSKVRDTIFQDIPEKWVDRNRRELNIPSSVKFADIDDKTDNFLSKLVIYQIHISVMASIVPAIKQIRSACNITDEFVSDLISNSSFIPNGHHGFFIEGIMAGFALDFQKASVFIIPQIENSLRYILESNGEIIANLNPNGTQNLNNIESIIVNPILTDVVGESKIKLLHRLLVDPRIGNLRNSIAHGFIEFDELTSPPSIYLWWLVLGMIVSLIPGKEIKLN
jgi:hypothetical protein